MLRWKSKKIPVRYLRCCIRSFVRKGYWKDARELLLERIFKERFFTEENGRRVPYRIDRVEIVLYQKPRDIARSTEGKLLFRDLKPYLQIFGYFFCSGQRQLVR